jgi:hypothetical protein
MKNFFQVPDCIPTVVTGGNHNLCLGGQDLVPLYLKAFISLRSIPSYTVEAAATTATEIVFTAG